jgi:hypothetical protein
MMASVPTHALRHCTLTFRAGPYRSQTSIVGATSDKRVSDILGLTDPDTVKNAHLRQDRSEFLLSRF